MASALAWASGPGWSELAASQGEPFSSHPDVLSWRLRHVTDAMVALFKAQMTVQARTQRGGRR